MPRLVGSEMCISARAYTEQSQQLQEARLKAEAEAETHCNNIARTIVMQETQYNALLSWRQHRRALTAAAEAAWAKQNSKCEEREVEMMVCSS